jgi:predicted RNA-binding Zn-ribbon protein involved in translation (DUF1610 family)
MFQNKPNDWRIQDLRKDPRFQCPECGGDGCPKCGKTGLKEDRAAKAADLRNKRK